MSQILVKLKLRRSHLGIYRKGAPAIRFWPGIEYWIEDNCFKEELFTRVDTPASPKAKEVQPEERLAEPEPMVPEPPTPEPEEQPSDSEGVQPKRRGGRPPGSKNKPKVNE